MEERRTPAGDIPAAMRTLADHYERLGQTALLMLAQEAHDDLARKVTDRGKAMHRQWVTEAFAPATADERVLDLLVVATDVYTWKLLRLDRGHSRAVTERRMHDLVDAVLASTTSTRRTEMADLLFVTWDGGGNVPPALGIAQGAPAARPRCPLRRARPAARLPGSGRVRRRSNARGPAPSHRSTTTHRSPTSRPSGTAASAAT